MSYPQKLGALWWTKNIRYLVYFLRELTGVVISGYILYTLWKLAHLVFLPETFDYYGFLKNFRIVSIIGLAAAIFHTITWFWVTMKISPIRLSKTLQIIGFFGLVALWLALSYFIMDSDLFYHSNS